jgi:hypothetical protein
MGVNRWKVRFGAPNETRIQPNKPLRFCRGGGMLLESPKTRWMTCGKDTARPVEETHPSLGGGEGGGTSEDSNRAADHAVHEALALGCPKAPSFKKETYWSHR